MLNGSIENEIQYKLSKEWAANFKKLATTTPISLLDGKNHIVLKLAEIEGYFSLYHELSEKIAEYEKLHQK